MAADALAWRRRARLRLGLTRAAQCLALGAAAAVAVGLVARVEGASPAAAALAFVLATAWALRERPPWAPPDAAVDPERDADGLLRTALSAGVAGEALEGLAEKARGRPVRARPFPEVRPVAGILVVALAVAAWSAAEPAYRLGARGESGDAGAATAADGGRDAEDPRREPGTEAVGDGAPPGALGQWEPVAVGADGRTALRGADVPLRARAAVERYRQLRTDERR